MTRGSEDSFIQNTVISKMINHCSEATANVNIQKYCLNDIDL